MAALISHLITYAAVNGLLVAIWTMTTGSPDELSDVLAQPSTALDAGFWPIWPMLGWGTALVIHAGSYLGYVLTGGPLRKRRKRLDKAERQAMKVAAKAAVPPARPGTAAPEVHDDAPIFARGRYGSTAGDGAAGPSGSAPPVRQWVAVMFTDIADSTTMAETLGDQRWVEILGAHRALVRTALGEYRGEEVSTQGDGFLVRFVSPDAAVACAVAIQSRIAEEKDRGEFSPAVRIGIHAGEVMADDNDLLGRVINLASRVTAAATPGEVLVTEPVADHLQRAVRLDDRGLQPLKGVPQPRHLLAVDWQTPSEVIVLDD